MAYANPVISDKFPDLAKDKKLALSHIDSGCLVYNIEGEIHTIIKDTDEDISSAIGSGTLSFSFTPILKSEFPSVHLNINYNTDHGQSGRYEYFFMVESENDLSVLHKLTTQNRTYLHIYNGNEACSFYVEFSRGEAGSVMDALKKINPLLTKTNR